MSYQVLARKWRPRDFAALVGQEHVIRALTHALDHKRLHHAYLFTGTRGVGKTTLSRILAKALNCVGPDGKGDVTSTPCNQCEVCRAVDAGRFIDYIEMDAASNRGVDDMVQLLERAIYAPSQARFKVYMIDEVHMLSTHAFNAMLKTLEEPPEYVKFVLATTDPQKLPVTVLSRCLQFNLKQMAPAAIAEHLMFILSQEAIEADPAALGLLSNAAGGSMRDALSLLDQAIAYSAGRISMEAVRGMLGAIDTTVLTRLLSAIASGDGVAAIAVADEMVERTLSFSHALRDLASMLHRIALQQMLGNDTVLSELNATDEYRALVHLATAMSPEEVQLHYQIAIHGRNELHLAPDEYAGFTMTVLRMLAFKPAEVLGGQTESKSAALSISRPVRTTAALPQPRPAVQSADAIGEIKPPTGALPRAISKAVSSHVALTTGHEALTANWSLAAVASHKASPSNANAKETSVDVDRRPGTQPLNTDPFDGDWPALVAKLPLRGLTRELAARSELIGFKDSKMKLRIPTGSLLGAGCEEKLQAAVNDHFGCAVKLSYEIGASTQASVTAAGRADLVRSELQQMASHALQSDPVVRKLMNDFDATIDETSIRPQSL